jgi:hypothetical protein
MGEACKSFVMCVWTNISAFPAVIIPLSVRYFFFPICMITPEIWMALLEGGIFLFSSF